MKTQNEIPTESRQQVISKLKNIKENIILTSPIFGVPEAYLNAYKKQSTSSTIRILTEMHEIRTQIGIRNQIDLQFYIELSLAIALCEQLIIKESGNEKLESMRIHLKTKMDQFLVGMEHDNRDTYYKGCILKPIITYLKDKEYKWEWIVMNYDKPILEAKAIQECMYQFMIQFEEGPSHIIISAYDDCLKGQEAYHGFRVINFPETINYEQLRQEACMILHYLYPNLQRHRNIIERVLNSTELQQLYIKKEYTPTIFMKGIREFYYAYYSIDSIACFISFEEHLSAIQDYMNRCAKASELMQSEKKKSKLYI